MLAKGSDHVKGSFRHLRSIDVFFRSFIGNWTWFWVNDRNHIYCRFQAILMKMTEKTSTSCHIFANKNNDHNKYEKPNSISITNHFGLKILSKTLSNVNQSFLISVLFTKNAADENTVRGISKQSPVAKVRTASILEFTVSSNLVDGTSVRCRTVALEDCGFDSHCRFILAKSRYVYVYPYNQKLVCVLRRVVRSANINNQVTQQSTSKHLSRKYCKICQVGWLSQSWCEISVFNESCVKRPFITLLTVMPKSTHIIVETSPCEMLAWS